MVDEAELDLDSGTNSHDAYIMPLMNVCGGTSRLADGLMDMSTCTVGNVSDLAWHTIRRHFRAHASLCESKVLTLPLVGDFATLYFREDVFAMHGLAVPRTLEEYVLTDMNGNVRCVYLLHVFLDLSLARHRRYCHDAWLREVMVEGNEGDVCVQQVILSSCHGVF